MHLVEAVAQLCQADGGTDPEHHPHAPGDDMESLLGLRFDLLVAYPVHGHAGTRKQ